MSYLAFPFFFLYVCVFVLDVLSFQFAISRPVITHITPYHVNLDIMHNQNFKFKPHFISIFKVFDSAVKVVLYFIFSNVTIPAVWFPFTTSTSSTPSLDMAHSSVVVTFPCKEIKILITTIAAKITRK